MAYLTLNGITIPVAAAQAPTLEQEEWGQRGRSGAGRLQNGVRASKRTWHLRTKPLSLSDARFLRLLIDGRGVHISFDSNNNSDHGLAPARSYGVNAGQGPGSLGGNQAPYAQAIASGTANYGAGAEWRLAPASEWTLLATCYRPIYPSGSNAWRRFMVRSDGARWHWTSAAGTPVRDDANADPKVVGFIGESGLLWFRAAVYGGRAWAASARRELGERMWTTSTGHGWEVVTAGTTGASAPTWPTGANQQVTDGTVVWRNIGDGNGCGYCGDLALLPYIVPSAYVDAMGAFYANRPWSALPHLSIGGDIVGLGDTGSQPALQVVGEAGEGDVRQSASGLVESFEFTLSEV